MIERKLLLASAEFTTSAGHFALALLMPDGEHRTVKIGEALSSMELRIARVREALVSTPSMKVAKCARCGGRGFYVDFETQAEIVCNCEGAKP